MSPKQFTVAALSSLQLLAALPARAADLPTVVCESKGGERQHCDADAHLHGPFDPIQTRQGNLDVDGRMTTFVQPEDAFARR